MIRGFSAIFFLAALAGLLIFGAPSEAQVAPVLEITSVPIYGVRPGSLSGRVFGVNPAAYRVTALVFVSGLGFYTKPYCNATTTPLGADGSFTVLLTTGGIDEYATFIAVLAVPASASVPCYSAEPGVPVELEQQAIAQKLVSRPNPNQREIQFAGETWVVKSLPAPVGPGQPTNYFSDSQENVWVDNLGRLHLRITNRNGRWYCAEIVSKRVIGYGRYNFQIETIPKFDRNVVFGGFTWAEAERDSHEIDMLELGRFGNANDPNNAQNVVQPWTTSGHQKRFLLPEIQPTVHETAWLPDSLYFKSSDALDATLHEWTYGGTPPDDHSSRLNFRFNLWLFGPPSDGQEAEIIVSRFSFTPMSKAGVFLDGEWYQDVNGNGVWEAGADRHASFGWPGTTQVLGDWNGDGKTDIGIFYEGFWYLDYNGNGVWDGVGTDRAYAFGWPGVTPLVGDWNGDGMTEVGVFSDGLWYLDYSGNGAWDGFAIDRAYSFGGPGMTPIIGDWNGDGKTEVGVCSNGVWYLDYNGNGGWDGVAADRGYSFGWPGVTPLVGDWNGDGKTEIAVFSDGYWYVDYNGNGVWDGFTTDKGYGFGWPGVAPVVGNW